MKDIIKTLDEMEVGIPLIVKFKSTGIRKVTVYGGTTGNGYYNFIDDSGAYKCTTGYIREKLDISTTLDQEEDLFELVKLNKEIKGGK